MVPSGTADFAPVDDVTLYEGMAEAARLGLPVAVHAESATITLALQERATGCGWADYLASRPVIAEIEAIGRSILFAEEVGCALHIVHVSTGRGVRLVAEARERGVDVSCETCPHYLVFDEEDLERLGAVAKCAPPLRSSLHRNELRAALADGRIDLLASDHAPCPTSMKEGTDAFAIWGGISGCQSLYALTLTEGFDTSLITARPAERFRLAAKGRLEPGADADIVLVDMSAETPLQTDELRYRHPHSPYVGRPLRGRIVQTLLRGRRIVAGEPHGRLIRPQPRHGPTAVTE
jgi:allantoinase